jgi:putative acetyltransferase
VTLRIIDAQLGEPLQQAGRLMFEYAQSLNLNVCFQSVEQEIAALPGEFGAAKGGLWLALLDSEPCGIVALRHAVTLADSEFITKPWGEVKRLYVQPSARGHGVANALIASLTAHAKQLGFAGLLLDTRSDMTPAISLYRKLGFESVSRYNDNPDAQVFFAKRF